MGLYHKTYYGRNLLISMKLVFVPSKLFKPRQVFEGKVRSLLEWST